MWRILGTKSSGQAFRGRGVSSTARRSQLDEAYALSSPLLELEVVVGTLWEHRGSLASVNGFTDPPYMEFMTPSCYIET